MHGPDTLFGLCHVIPGPRGRRSADDSRPFTHPHCDHGELLAWREVRLGRDSHIQSIQEYNGGSVVAMVGKDCVAIACDMRLGQQSIGIAMNFEKVRPVMVVLR